MSSPAAQLVFHVFGAIAQFDRCGIAGEIENRIAAARADGKLPACRSFDPAKAEFTPIPVREPGITH